MPAGVPVIVLDYHINDEGFADAIIEQALAFQTGASPAGGPPQENPIQS
jgi:hypothetical protein